VGGRADVGDLAEDPVDPEGSPVVPVEVEPGHVALPTPGGQRPRFHGAVGHRAGRGAVAELHPALACDGVGQRRRGVQLHADPHMAILGRVVAGVDAGLGQGAAGDLVADCRGQGGQGQCLGVGPADRDRGRAGGNPVGLPAHHRDGLHLDAERTQVGLVPFEPAAGGGFVPVGVQAEPVTKFGQPQRAAQLQDARQGQQPFGPSASLSEPDHRHRTPAPTPSPP
jgi:hypothetical protein